MTHVSMKQDAIQNATISVIDTAITVFQIIAGTSVGMSMFAHIR